MQAQKAYEKRIAKMPIEIEKDGAKINVFTQDELDAKAAEIEGKYAGYVPGDKLEAEKNAAAAAARKAAESEKSNVEKELEKLRGQLESAKGNTDKLAELNQKIADLETEKGTITKRGKLAISLLKAGLNKDYIDDALQLRSFTELDPDDAKFDENLTSLRESKKLFFTSDIGEQKQEVMKKQASGGAGGSTNPSTNVSYDSVNNMSMAEYAAKRKSGELV